MTTLAHAKNLRTGRFSQPGLAYLLTTATQHRWPLFTDFHRARLAIDELRLCDELGLVVTLAFVLMPDHLHWLVQLTEGDLASTMKRFKSRSAARINDHQHTRGQYLWQAGFHDHGLRDNDDLQQIARYIVANPVRAGLVNSAGLYPHWDAVWVA